MNILVFSTVAGNADNLLYLFKFLTKKGEGESHKHLNPFAPEPPVTARADPGPFYPL